MPVLSKEQLTERAQLVAVFESACSLAYPEEGQLAFRLDVMKKLGTAFALKNAPARADGPITKDELRERAQLVRLYKSSCRIDYPSKLEARFRDAITKKLQIGFGIIPPPAAAAKATRACPHN